MKAAFYFLLLTSLAGISIINSTCFCSNETTEIDIYEFQSCPYSTFKFLDEPLPSIFASEPSTFPVSLPLLTFEQLLQQLSSATVSTTAAGNNLPDSAADIEVTSTATDNDDELRDSVATSDNCPHPFENLMEYIYFVNGSSINFDSFEDEPSSDVHPTLDEISKDLKNVEDYNSIVELDENVEVEEDFTVVIDFVGGNDEREFAIILEFVNEVTDDQIEDEEDYTFEFGVDDVEDQSHVVNPTVENRQIKRSRFIPMLRSIFKIFSILALGVIGLLSMFYLFVLSIVVYVFLKDYFAERFDAETNEHFRQLLHQLKNEHKLCRPKQQQLAVSSISTKKDQEQQTDIVEDDYEELDTTLGESLDECSSEVDVTMDDTISHSCA